MKGSNLLEKKSLDQLFGSFCSVVVSFQITISRGCLLAFNVCVFLSKTRNVVMYNKIDSLTLCLIMQHVLTHSLYGYICVSLLLTAQVEQRKRNDEKK